jgi:hypothetical protein
MFILLLPCQTYWSHNQPFEADTQKLYKEVTITDLLSDTYQLPLWILASANITLQNMICPNTILVFCMIFKNKNSCYFVYVIKRWEFLMQSTVFSESYRIYLVHHVVFNAPTFSFGPKDISFLAVAYKLTLHSSFLSLSGSFYESAYLTFIFVVFVSQKLAPLPPHPISRWEPCSLQNFLRLLMINPLRLRKKLMQFVFKNSNNVSECKQLSLIAKRFHFGSTLWNRLFSPAIHYITVDLFLAMRVPDQLHTFFFCQY